MGGTKEFYGEYSLFKEVESIYLKHRNRGAVLANIVEDNSWNFKVSQIGLEMAKEYMELLEEDERMQAYNAMREVLLERGWEIDEQ